MIVPAMVVMSYRKKTATDTDSGHKEERKLDNEIYFVVRNKNKPESEVDVGIFDHASLRKDIRKNWRVFSNEAQRPATLNDVVGKW